MFFFLMKMPPPRSTLPDTRSPDTTLFLSRLAAEGTRRPRTRSWKYRAPATSNACLCRGQPYPVGVDQLDQSSEARFRYAREPPRRYGARSEEHTSELQSLMRLSYAVFCLTTKTHTQEITHRAPKK